MNRARDVLKSLIGRTAEFASPRLGREIDEATNNSHAVKLKRAIHHARLSRAQAAGDIGSIERSLADFWKGEQGDTFHNKFIEWRFDYFLDHHTAIVDALNDLPAVSGLSFRRMVEIGCGDGNALAYCTERLPWIERAIGLDINAAVIARNALTNTFDEKISFVAADARQWLAENPEQGTVVFTNGGVLEYFSQESFDHLLATLGGSRPAAIAMIEPVAPDHDLAREAGSRVFGRERSFSHNHRQRLNGAGFDVMFEREFQVSEVRWMLMIGVAK